MVMLRVRRPLGPPAKSAQQGPVPALGQPGKHPLWSDEPIDPNVPLPIPEAEVDWPGLPPGLVFDPSAPTPDPGKGKPKQKVPGQLFQEGPDGARTPVADPGALQLDPTKPYEPNLAGTVESGTDALRADYWRSQFRQRLSPEQSAQVDDTINAIRSEQEARSRYRQLDTKVQVRNIENRPLAELKKNDQALIAEWSELKHRFGPLPRPAGGIPPPPTDYHVGNLPTQKHADFASPEGYQQGVANILAMLRAARPDEIKYWKNWYTFANKDTKQLATRYSVPEGVVAGIVAALSPNAAWESNIYAAQRVLEGYGRKHIDSEDRADAAGATDMLKRVYPELVAKPDKLGVFTYTDNIRKAQAIYDAWAANKDQRWDPKLGGKVQIEWDPTSKRDIARAAKQFEALRGRAFTGWATKTPNSWAPFARIENFNPEAGRLVMVPPLGDPDMGAKKVNAFYENVLNPGKSADNPVVDGHAANIFYGNPNRKLDEVGLKDAEYDGIKAAYKEAASLSGPILAEKGLGDKPLTPQQIQAVTWSVWRKAIKKKPPKQQAGQSAAGDPPFGFAPQAGVSQRGAADTPSAYGVASRFVSMHEHDLFLLLRDEPSGQGLDHSYAGALADLESYARNEYVRWVWGLSGRAPQSADVDDFVREVFDIAQPELEQLYADEFDYHDPPRARPTSPFATPGNGPANWPARFKLPPTQGSVLEDLSGDDHVAAVVTAAQELDADRQLQVFLRQARSLREQLARSHAWGVEQALYHARESRRGRKRLGADVGRNGGKHSVVGHATSSHASPTASTEFHARYALSGLSRTARSPNRPQTPMSGDVIVHTRQNRNGTIKYVVSRLKGVTSTSSDPDNFTREPVAEYEAHTQAYEHAKLLAIRSGAWAWIDRRGSAPDVLKAAAVSAPARPAPPLPTSKYPSLSPIDDADDTVDDERAVDTLTEDEEAVDALTDDEQPMPFLEDEAVSEAVDSDAPADVEPPSAPVSHQTPVAPLFDSTLTSALPDEAFQPQRAPEALFAQAQDAHEQQLDFLDRGAGLAADLGAVTVRGDLKEDATAALDAPGPVVLIGPMKKMERSGVKVQKDYRGDWSKLTDIVRSSIAVDTYAEIPGLVRKLLGTGIRLARKPKDRFTQPTAAGYRDILLNVIYPNGHIAELQLHVKSMFKAKDIGHKYYDQVRTIEALVDAEGKRKLTPEEQAVVDKANAKAQALYAKAWAEAQGGGVMSGKTAAIKTALAQAGPYYVFDDFPALWERGKLPVVLKPGGAQRVDMETFFREAQPLTAEQFDALRSAREM